MKLPCRLCPHHCRLDPGQTGICGARVNRDGAVVDAFYGLISAAAMDPIEKKPLYHFFPGSQILSLGFYGCSFHCPFCQNHAIARGKPREGARKLSPADAVTLARDNGSFGIAYTYSEPTVHHEYLMDTAREARAAGLKNVLISNGFLNPEPARMLLALTDAANIDLKGFTEEFYRRELKGSLEPVKEFIRMAAAMTHLEVTTLVIPGRNDSPEEIEAMARFLSTLSRDIPYHLSAYHPSYRYTAPPTDPGTLLGLVEVARRHLNYVYTGNIAGGDSSTYCPACGALLVERRGYGAVMRGINQNRCTECGKSTSVINHP